MSDPDLRPVPSGEKPTTLILGSTKTILAAFRGWALRLDGQVACRNPFTKKREMRFAFGPQGEAMVDFTAYAYLPRVDSDLSGVVEALGFQDDDSFEGPNVLMRASFEFESHE